MTTRFLVTSMKREKRKTGLLEFYAWASWGAAVLCPYKRKKARWARAERDVPGCANRETLRVAVLEYVL